MKINNLFFLIIALLFSIISFSQETDIYQKDLDKLLNANNGSASFDKIVEMNLDKMPVSKQALLIEKSKKAAERIRKEASFYFKKKYSLQEINTIYREFTTPGRMDYSGKTLSFIREWTSYKKKYQKEFRQIFMEVQR